MRTVFFLIALSVAPGEYAAAASLQPPICALGLTWPIKVAANGNGAAAEQPAPSALVEGEATKQNAGSTAGLLSEAPDIDQVPVLKHISETGAKIFDLGMSHGVRGVLARLGEEFIAVDVISLFIALLSSRGISTPSLQARGEQRRFFYFNNDRDIP